MNWELNDVIAPMIAKCMADIVTNGNQSSQEECTVGNKGLSVLPAGATLNESFGYPELVSMLVFPLAFEYCRTQFTAPTQLSILEHLVQDRKGASWMYALFGESLPEPHKTTATSNMSGTLVAVIQESNPSLVRSW